ncbi:MAG: hypothetical protein IJK78_07555 [Bacteroidales bacterium]|nr:hypothetical protein [Bacteroidales bacterium]
MEMKDDAIIFESDDEFVDFCVAPFATVEQSEKGTPLVKGDFSEQYKHALKEGKAFVIKGKDSAVCRRKSVSKRVPIEGVPNRMALIQLDDVQNVMDYRTWEFFGTDLL